MEAQCVFCVLEKEFSNIVSMNFSCLYHKNELELSGNIQNQKCCISTPLTTAHLTATPPLSLFSCNKDFSLSKL